MKLKDHAERARKYELCESVESGIASRGEWVIRVAGWAFIVVSCIAIIWLAV